MTDQQLRDRIEELERALTPFANYAAAIPEHSRPFMEMARIGGRVLTVGHFRRAGEALKVRP